MDLFYRDTGDPPCWMAKGCDGRTRMGDFAG